VGRKRPRTSRCAGALYRCSDPVSRLQKIGGEPLFW
jgi:hypothetical protein